MEEPCPPKQLGDVARILKDSNTLGAPSNPQKLTNVGGTLYFIANDT